MSGAISGHKGAVKIAAANVLDINSWSLDRDRNILETTSMGDASIPWRTYIPGLSGATGKLDGNLNMTDTTGQLALFNSMSNDAPVNVDLYLDSIHKFSVAILVGKWSGKVPIDGTETVSFDFTVTGPATYA